MRNGKPQKQIGFKMFDRAWASTTFGFMTCAILGVEARPGWYIVVRTQEELRAEKTLEMAKYAYLTQGHPVQHAVMVSVQQSEKAKTPPARVALAA